MENPVPNLGRCKDDRDKDYDPNQLCDHCRVKLGSLLLTRNGSTLGSTHFEFADHLYEVRCLR